MPGDRVFDLNEVLVEQHLRWHAGDLVPAEKLMEQCSCFADQPDSVLDLIYSEVLLRERFGQRPTEREYVERFPELRTGIARQFQLHRSLCDKRASGEPTTGGVDDAWRRSPR